MKKGFARNYLSAVVFTLLFIVFTLVIRFIDVDNIGPQGSPVGLAHINGPFFEAFGYNKVLYTVSELLGYVAIGVAAGFAAYGVWQLIKLKSLKKVDPKIICLGVFYAVVIAFYALFEVVVINYRPVLSDEGLEASYPSSHTMLAVCVFGSAIIMIRDLFAENRRLKLCSVIILSVLMAAVILTRLFSGVHWLTDIIGGIILSLGLCFIFKGITEQIGNK